MEAGGSEEEKYRESEDELFLSKGRWKSANVRRKC
jgi:hypothetical protein